MLIALHVDERNVTMIEVEQRMHVRCQYVRATIQLDQLATCDNVVQRHTLVSLVVIVVASEEGHGIPLLLYPSHPSQVQPY